MTATIKEFLFRAAMMVHLQMHFSYPLFTFFAYRLFATIVKVQKHSIRCRWEKRRKKEKEEVGWVDLE